MKAGEPLFQDVILYGRELTQDDLFDENEKEMIARDMAQLQENYDELRNFVDDEQERFVFSACYHTSSRHVHACLLSILFACLKLIYAIAMPQENV